MFPEESFIMERIYLSGRIFRLLNKDGVKKYIRSIMKDSSGWGKEVYGQLLLVYLVDAGTIPSGPDDAGLHLA